MRTIIILFVATLLAVFLTLPFVPGAVQAETAVTREPAAAALVYLPMVRGLRRAPMAIPSVTPSPTRAATTTPTTTPVPTESTATPVPTQSATPSPTPGQTATPASSDWAFGSQRYRVLVTVNMNGTTRSDKPAEVAMDFTALLAGAGDNSAFNPNTLRVVEVDAKNKVLSGNVPFQFDPGASYNARSNARGTMVVMLEGQSSGRSDRRYHVYFDTLNGAPAAPANVAPRVVLTDGVIDEGWPSYEVETNAATYLYHKEGGGFSSLIEKAGNDWISYSAAPGAKGDFRGIPNMVHPDDGGYFHPGRSGVISSAVSAGPLKATILSRTIDGNWETMWEIFPDYARLTVLKAAAKYWFLYEGTPGGLLEVESDYVVRSDGRQTTLDTPWKEDLAAPEWLYFSDPTIGRSLYLVHHEDDALIDSYEAMNEAMTVFGFGRDSGARYLTQTPAHFTLGFVDGTGFSAVESALNNAYKPLNIYVGTAEQQSAPVGRS